VHYFIATGKAGADIGSFATNGYGDRSPGKYGLLACLVSEVVMTFGFVRVILGATDRRAPAAAAPLAIGLALTLIHLVSIPVTNTSVNPARSTAPALFVGGGALGQLWLFWLAPLVGAILAGLAYKLVAETAAALGDLQQDEAGRDCAQYLRNDVGQQVPGGEAPTGPQAETHRRIEVGAGDVPERIGAGQHGQAEGQGHADETDAEWIAVAPELRRQHCAAAATKHQPERAEELGHEFLPKIHAAPRGS
jgi:hypothetical protein